MASPAQPAAGVPRHAASGKERRPRRPVVVNGARVATHILRSSFEPFSLWARSPSPRCQTSIPLSVGQIESAQLRGPLRSCFGDQKACVAERVA